VRKLAQGEIWWANLPAPAGRRPVLLLTRTPALNVLSHVTIAPLTRTIRNIPSQVVISPAEGVPSLSAASLDSILTIPRSLLHGRIAKLSSQSMHEVFRAIRFVFGIPHSH